MKDIAEQKKILEELRRLSTVMDASVGIPGTKFKFGADSVIGLVPVVGDVTGMLISLYLVIRARQLGVPWRILVKMVGNNLIDAGFGTIPVVGDAFDFFFKANVRNFDLVLDAVPSEVRELEDGSEAEK